MVDTMDKNKKILASCIIAVVMTLTFYPVTELTRVILNYWSNYGYVAGFKSELAVIWGFYLAIPPLVWYMIKQGVPVK
jgi:hypothetical protein